MAEFGLLDDEALLLLPFHAEGRVRQHIVEGEALAFLVAVEAVLGEGVAQDDVVGVGTLDEHVRLADCPGFVVPVLPEQNRVGLAVQACDVGGGLRQHAARATGGVVDRLDDVAAAQILFGS